MKSCLERETSSSSEDAEKPITFVEVPAEGMHGRGQHDGDKGKGYGSASSVLTSRSSHSIDSDTCESTSTSLPLNMEMLEQHFAFRDQLLRCIQEEEMSREDNEMLREAEEAFRTEATKYLAPLAEEEEEQGKGNRLPSNGLQERKTCARRSLLQQEVTFDLHYTLPGIANILLYCVAHLSMFELCNAVIEESCKDIDYQDPVYCCVLGLGILLYRLTGGLYEWLDDASYERVRSELKNRFRLQTGVEASVLRWFHRHHKIRDVASLCAFYVCFVCVVYFLQDRVLRLLDIGDDILEMLPSAQQGDNTSISLMLATGELAQYSGIPRYAEEESCYEFGFCDEREANLTEEDDWYLYSQVSPSSYYRRMGYSDTPIISSAATLLVFGTLAFLSFAALGKLGCDLALF